MWWLLNTPQTLENMQIEINPAELQKFLIKEALFLKAMDQRFEALFNYQNWLNGRAWTILEETYRELLQHFMENMNYFTPKEMK
ncbi:MAG TPA: hypothetical protein DHW82_00570 [Spirochaetia bacterium]|nr:MAG: hypothetical protein A2Y41_04385 [Spirochaetes bacterium GWB1_36_13]HCL55493.1 hypothetical protein [Spirochaetia bacterium]